MRYGPFHRAPGVRRVDINTVDINTVDIHTVKQYFPGSGRGPAERYRQGFQITDSEASAIRIPACPGEKQRRAQAARTWPGV